MMVCHCHGITDRKIHEAMQWMRAADPETIITPGKIFRALGKKADCAGCLPLFVERMALDPNLEIPLLTTPAVKRALQRRGR